MRQPVPAQQALRGTAATLTWQPAGADGEPAEPAGTVTVTVTKADGTAIVTGAATSGSDAGARTYVLGAQAELELITATWIDDGTPVASTLVEIVGGYWFSIADVRARDQAMTATMYPDPRILAVRAEVEALLEDATHSSWVPRYRRAEVFATTTCDLVVPNVALRTVRSIRRYDLNGVDYTAFTDDELAGLRGTRWGTIEANSSVGWAAGASYVVEYEHGWDRPPADLRDEAITLLRYRLNSHRAGTPDRATSMSSGGTSYTLSTPGQKGSITGIPSVDAAIDRYKFRDFGLA